jgi:pimeloyl-ACP methyl ester carboxylesterase
MAATDPPLRHALAKAETSETNDTTAAGTGVTDSATDIFNQPDFVNSTGVPIAVYHDGPHPVEAGKPPVVFLHGFPALARSFRHQMAGLAQRGYPVFAPDMRGYGRSGRLEGRPHYSAAALVSDLRAILDHFHMRRAVFVGHGDGARLLWALPFYMPERLLGCAALGRPLLPRDRLHPLLALWLGGHGRSFDLQVQREGRCEPLLEADVARTLRFFLRSAGEADDVRPRSFFRNRADSLLDRFSAPEASWAGSPLLGAAEMAAYVDAFTRGGFTAPLHARRNLAHNWRELKRYSAGGRLPFVHLPCLMVTAERDRAWPSARAASMHRRCGPLTRVDIAGCGHWMQFERPGAVTNALAHWLAASVSGYGYEV